MNRTRRDDPGFIYFVACGKRYIKIGWAKDVERRIRVMQSGNPEPLILLAQRPGTRRQERLIHWRLKDARLDEKSEWFEAESVLEYMAGHGLLRSKRRSAEAA